MPGRPVGDQRVGLVAPTPPPPLDEGTGNHSAPHHNDKTSAGPSVPPSRSYVEALSRVYGSRGAHESRKVLSLFSG
eukprot:5054810-Prymnesium_polylepis.1